MKLWSNLFFLIPLALAASNGLYLYVVVIGAVFMLSVAFHLHEGNKILFYADMIFSGLLMFANFLLLFMSGWVWPWSALAVLSAAAAIWAYAGKLKYSPEINHGLWHILSAAVSLFCLLAVI